MNTDKLASGLKRGQCVRKGTEAKLLQGVQKVGKTISENKEVTNRHLRCEPHKIMMRRFILLGALAALVLPAYANLETCIGTATDSSGQVQPWACPDNWLRGLGSSLTASGGTLSGHLENYIWPRVVAPPGLVVRYNGETATSSSGEFVVSGGSGTGKLMGHVSADLFANFINGGVRENYSSNFIPFSCVRGCDVLIPFTFDVPFSLTLADQFDFFGDTSLGRPLGSSEIEDVTRFDVTLGVFDDSGHPISGASIAEVPELSSMMLLTTVAGLVFMLRHTRSPRRAPRS